MASIYRKGNKIYISWWDPNLNKTQNKSTGLEYSQKNLKQAKLAAKLIQEKLDEEKETLKTLNIKQITIASAFDHFIRINADKHPKTIKDYKRFYRYFTQTFNEDDPCTVLNKLSIEDWLLDIRKLSMQQNSIHGLFRQCRHFLNFLFEYNYLPMFKINRSVAIKAEVKEKIIFTDEHLAKIFTNLDKKTSNFKTLLYVAYYTGLRSSDILTITTDRIDLERRELRYYSPKRDRYRAVAFHEDLVPILKVRIEEVGTGKLFEYSNVESMGRAIKRYFDKLEIDHKGYTARTFRKTFITTGMRMDMNPSIVKELVGHEHQSTTDRFYNRIGFDEMIRELEKYPSIEDIIKEQKEKLK